MSTAWTDNFATSGLNSSIFSNKWGASSEFSSSSIGVTVASNGSSAGFMQMDNSASAGNGYGTYSATFSMHGAGAYVCLWPSTNAWPGPEIDLTEATSGGQGFLTVHWKNASGGDSYNSHIFSANLSQSNTVSVDWEKSGLTFDVNGQQVAQFLSGGSVPVPKDYADGGQNEAFGVGNVGTAGASITLSKMSYTPSSGTTVAAPAPAPAPAPTPIATHIVSAVTPSTTIAVSNPAMQFVANPSLGANASITMSDPGLKNIYAVVMTSGNVAESGWQEFATNSAGSATHSFHFQHSGDYVLAINDPSKIVDKGYSGHIVIAHS